tara:strand:+ start:54 stop:521 length:468 start_codon:yes stop_codon:yes gene_type:complete
VAVRLKKEYFLDVDKQLVWNAILDPNILSKILPNCQSLVPEGKNKYTAHINVKIGPISSKFKSSFEMFDIQELNGYKFRINGDGVKGSMNGHGEIQLQSKNDGTSFIFIAEGNVTGVIARVGQRLIEATGKKLMDRGFEDFKIMVMGKSVVQASL